MPNEGEYKKEWAAYDEAAKKSAGGDKQARSDKARIRETIRRMEREDARDGRIVTPVRNRGGVAVEVDDVDNKRSLQEEYCRKFDKDVTVMIPDKPGSPPKEQTLREFHRKRLGLSRR